MCVSSMPMPNWSPTTCAARGVSVVQRGLVQHGRAPDLHVRVVHAHAELVAHHLHRQGSLDKPNRGVPYCHVRVAHARVAMGCPLRVLLDFGFGQTVYWRQLAQLLLALEQP